MNTMKSRYISQNEIISFDCWRTQFTSIPGCGANFDAWKANEGFPLNQTCNSPTIFVYVRKKYRSSLRADLKHILKRCDNQWILSHVGGVSKTCLLRQNIVPCKSTALQFHQFSDDLSCRENCWGATNHRGKISKTLGKSGVCFKRTNT